MTETTLGRLAHLSIGDPVFVSDVPEIERALISSELFRSVVVGLEPAGNGSVLVVATVVDKQSWIAAPTLFVLPGNVAVGAGYLENDLFGEDKKTLIYAQVGTANTFLLGTYLDPHVAGSPFSLRFDLYLQRRIVDEYANLDAGSFSIARTTTQLYLDAGALVGYSPRYWLTLDLRVRGAYVAFSESHAADGGMLPAPSSDGRDVTTTARVTADRRHHESGVTDGVFAQLSLEGSIPGASTYRYIQLYGRATTSWRLFGRHVLELGAQAGAGVHMPFVQELTAGGGNDQRGYAYLQFRGDVRAIGRLEYSVPVTRVGGLDLRGLLFWDISYTAFPSELVDTRARSFLPGEVDGHWTRNGVGAGVRVYASSVVLPLLGLDVGYGVESRAPQLYFEIGITDF